MRWRTIITHMIWKYFIYIYIYVAQKKTSKRCSACHMWFFFFNSILVQVARYFVEALKKYTNGREKKETNKIFFYFLSIFILLKGRNGKNVMQCTVCYCCWFTVNFNQEILSFIWLSKQIESNGVVTHVHRIPY